MIEALVTRLVHEAPVIDARVASDLQDALRADGRPLALAIARAVDMLVEQLVDPAVALPALAMACATLVSTVDGKVLAAAQFDVDALTPRPDPPSGLVSIRGRPRRT